MCVCVLMSYKHLIWDFTATSNGHQCWMNSSLVQLVNMLGAPRPLNMRKVSESCSEFQDNLKTDQVVLVLLKLWALHLFMWRGAWWEQSQPENTSCSRNFKLHKEQSSSSRQQIHHSWLDWSKRLDSSHIWTGSCLLTQIRHRGSWVM